MMGHNCILCRKNANLFFDEETILKKGLNIGQP